LLQFFSNSSAVAPLYSDDVFSAYTYTGNGGTQTLTTGLNFATYGGLTWIKARDATTNHKLTDTARGVQKALSSNTTAAQATDTTGLTAFGSTGFTVGTNADYNNTGVNYVAWNFRKAPKFFDIVTYTGNASNRTIAHNLGQAPGMIFIKDTSNASLSWITYHRSLPNTDYLVLSNSFSLPITAADVWNGTSATSSVFSVGTNVQVNATGDNFVAYLFSHDTATDSIIKSDTFTTNGSGVASVTLGWEPQIVIMRDLNGQNYTQVFDSSRGLFAQSNNGLQLFLGAANAEGVAPLVAVNATGFVVTQYASTQYVYTAIRRPNKPPTLGTQVYSAIARTGTGAAATAAGASLAPDLVMEMPRSAALGGGAFDRLRGPGNRATLFSGAAETNFSDSLTSFNMDGFSVGADGGWLRINVSGDTYINWLFKRAPGVFDVVCYTGNGANAARSHGLSAAPELMLVRGRSSATSWAVYSASLANTEYLSLNSTAAKASGTAYWNSTTPNATTFTVGTAADVNTNAATYVAYLFATMPGISKCGSYTGNGSSQTINAGFTTGARFVMIKRTDNAGDWYVWDSTRGIVAGNDPHLSLNTTAAEVTTDDTIDPDTSGFVVNQLAATNVNVTAATYIYLAFA
jgi:hypothetical protein